MIVFVIPAKAGIQQYKPLLDPGFRRGDGLKDFLRHHLHKVFPNIPKDFRDLCGLRGKRSFP
jgi:hypothetical protein